MRHLLYFFISITISFQSYADWFTFNNIHKSDSFPSHIDNATYDISPTKMVVAGNYIELDKVFADPKITSINPMHIYIYADTLHIKNSTLITLENRTLTIIARNITGKRTTVYMPKSPANRAGVSLVADKLESDFDVILISDDFQVQNLKSLKEDTGISVSLWNGIFSTINLPNSFSGFIQGNNTEMGKLLEAAFDLSLLTYDQNPTTSRDIATWTEKLLRTSEDAKNNDPRLKNLYFNAVRQVQFEETFQSYDNYVPSLDRTLYEDTYNEYLENLTIIEENYNEFIKDKNDSKARRETGLFMLNKTENIIKSEELIIEKKESNILTLEKGIVDLEQQFQIQERSVRSAQTGYRIGLIHWEKQQKYKMAFEVFTAIASLGEAVAGAVTGDITKLTSVATDIPEAAKEMTGLAKSIKEMVSTLEQVQKVSSSMNDLVKASNSKDGIDNLSAAMSGFIVDTPSISDTNNTWDFLSLDVNKDLKYADSLGVSGALEYLIELEKLIILGKSINGLQLSLSVEQSELIDLNLRQIVRVQEKSGIEDLLSMMEDSVDADRHLESYFTRSINDSKRSMYMALKNYIAAYEYWSLKSSSITPSLNKTVQEYRDELITINYEYNQALLDFQSPPQNFTVRSYKVENQSELKSLIDNGSFVLTIDESDTNFEFFNRVRLHSVRVKINSEDIALGENHYISISSGSEFKDKYKGEVLSFNSQPVSRTFAYTPYDDYIDIILDGSVSEEFKFAYFEPTPFTTWAINLLAFDEYDITEISSIEFEFIGTAIPYVN